MELNEIIELRKSKLEALKGKGACGYQSAPVGSQTVSETVKAFSEGAKAQVSGRITAKRLHGKVLFLDLKDAFNRIQLYVKADIIGKDKFDIFEHLDIADIITVSGELFKTHTGEATIKVEDVLVLSKALRPLPEKWHGLKDVEMRYRQRYLDLVSNEEVRKIFHMRSQIVDAIRETLCAEGFLEVETPMMHAIPGGAAGRPFKTFHNEYGFELYMRIAPELYLKRLLVGGLDKVYEINRSFRNEGVSTRHNPEFTMLEVYAAYKNYEYMMELSQKLIVAAAKKVRNDTKFTYQGKEIDLGIAWQKKSFAAMVKERFGIEPGEDAALMLKKLQEKGFAKDKNRLTRSQVGKIIEDLLEQDLSMSPTFVTDFFTSLSPLAQAKKDNPQVTERFELYIAGMEVGNAYSELNDPIEQKKRFEEEIKNMDTSELKNIDEDFIVALEHGMPPAGGLGIGIDRLVMLLTDSASIRDVILFPLLKPEK